MTKLFYIIYILLSSLVLSKPSINQTFAKAFSEIEVDDETYNNLDISNHDVIDGRDVYYYIESNNGLILSDGEVHRQATDEETLIKITVQIEGETRSVYRKTIVKACKPINLHTDLEVFYFNDAVEILIDEELNRDDYKFVLSDESCAEIDEDYILMFLKKEKFTLYVYDEYDYLVDFLDFDVRLVNPSITLTKKTFVISETFDYNVNNYKKEELEITIDNNDVLKYEDGRFVALNPGTATITFSLKEDNTSYQEIKINVYEKTPILETDVNEFVIGSSAKISVVNYALGTEYKISVNDESLAYVKDNFIIGKKAGTVIVKVALVDDETVFATVALKVTNIMPKLVVFNPNILALKTTYLSISNLSELLTDDINDFVFSSSNQEIATVSNDCVYAKKEGVVTLKCESKTYLDLVGECTLNIRKKPTATDDYGETSEGPLIISLSDNRRTYKVGEMITIEIEGLKSYDNYKYTSANNSMLNVLDNGKIITKEEGLTKIIVSNKNDNTIKGSVYIDVKGRMDVNYAERLIKVAEGELGYKELPNKETKYGIWYGIPDGDWCAMFVTWCAHYSGIGTDVIPFYCGCTAGWKWFIEHDCYGLKGSYTPKAGDIIFFLDDGAGHTGIVTGCSGGYVYTLEGNTSDMVARRSYPLDYHTITGYGIPKYK